MPITKGLCFPLLEAPPDSCHVDSGGALRLKNDKGLVSINYNISVTTITKNCSAILIK